MKEKKKWGWFFFFFSVGKCLITKLHITGIMMWNKYKKSGKILNTNRLHGNKLYNHKSINQQFIIINNVCLAVKYYVELHVLFGAHVPKAKLIPEVVLLTYTIGQHFRLSCAIKQSQC